jgi:hypothetical protein
MTSPTHDHTTATPITTDLARRATPSRVETALTDLDQAFLALRRSPTGDDNGWAAYSAAMALLCARRAGWWRVLITNHRYSLHPVYLRAAEIAHHKARDEARFWRETAADWQARAEHRPTSDAAGALSNWAALGVTG